MCDNHVVAVFKWGISQKGHGFESFSSHDNNLFWMGNVRGPENGVFCVGPWGAGDESEEGHVDVEFGPGNGVFPSNSVSF